MLSLKTIILLFVTGFSCVSLASDSLSTIFEIPRKIVMLIKGDKKIKKTLIEGKITRDDFVLFLMQQFHIPKSQPYIGRLRDLAQSVYGCGYLNSTLFRMVEHSVKRFGFDLEKQSPDQRLFIAIALTTILLKNHVDDVVVNLAHFFRKEEIEDARRYEIFLLDELDWDFFFDGMDWRKPLVIEIEKL